MASSSPARLSLAPDLREAEASIASLAPKPAAPVRLVSLDALRGMAILAIIGFDGAVASLAEMAKSGPPLFREICGFLALQFSHSEWDGVHLYDFVFPLFVFITGTGIAFALPRALASQTRGEVYFRIIRRSLLMYALGVIYYGGLGQHWEEIRYVGVLQRIAICYFVTSILFMHLRPAALAGMVAAILVAYWALMSFVAAPGMAAGSVEPGANLADWLDRAYLPGRLWYGERDPEGLLSTLPAITTCMLGALAGVLLQSGRAPSRINLALAVGGAAMVAVGWLWGLTFSIIIKALWTSSFVLVTAGASAILLGVANQLLDVWRLGSASWLVWVGANAITLYMISGLVGFDQLAHRLVGGDFGAFVDRVAVPGASAFLTHAVGLALAIWLAGFLYRKRVFVRL
jgi:predicted acyltransferase